MFSAVSRKRTVLYLSIGGLVATATAVSAVPAGDPDGIGLRAGTIMLTVSAALWLPWQVLFPAVLLIWLGPNYYSHVLVSHVLVPDATLFSRHTILELPGVLGLALFAVLVRQALHRIEVESLMLGATSGEFGGVDPDTGVYEERLMRPAIDEELARARRFNRRLALVLVGVDEMRQRFDYRDQTRWAASFNATAQLLRSTRIHIDRVYRYGASGFALLLPESGEREVAGLIRRLRHVARRAEPPEGEPGGPLLTHFGATFFPDCATTSDELIRRAQVALRVAEKNSNRVQIDSAEAPDLPEPQTLRRPQEEVDTPESAVLDTSSAPQDKPIVLSELTAEQEAETHEPAFSGPPSHLGDDAPAGEDESPLGPALLTPRSFGKVRPAAAPEPVLSSEVQLPRFRGQPVHEQPPGATLIVLNGPSDAVLLEESFDGVMKRLDETRNMIRILRSDQAA
jgi:diguanylate cyclase (GGDEF)-like protein